MGYTRDTFKGVSWVGSFRVATRGISLVRTIILARILAPAQFGVFGIATLILSFLEILTETGINVVLIQKRDKVSEYINTAWVVSIARGVIISLSLVALAPSISTFFNSTESKQLVYLISLVSLIRGFINPSIVYMQKELQFQKEFWFRFAIFAFDAGIAVVVSLITKNASGLVYGLIAGSVLELVMSFVFIKPRPKFSFEKEKILEVVSKGKWITGAGVFQFAFRQGDDAVVGRVLGETSLGFYQVAYKISTLPITEVTDVVNRVVFPVYTKISDDAIRLRRAFLRTSFVVLALSSTVGVTLFVFGDRLVPWILGEKWVAVIPLIKILSVFGVIQAVTNSANSLMLAVEKQRYLTNTTLLSFAAMLIAIFPLTQKYGLIGSSMAPLFGSLSAAPLVAFYIYKILWKK